MSRPEQLNEHVLAAMTVGNYEGSTLYLQLAKRIYLFRVFIPYY